MPGTVRSLDGHDGDGQGKTESTRSCGMNSDLKGVGLECSPADDRIGRLTHDMQTFALSPIR